MEAQQPAKSYSEGQLNQFSRLIRVAARFLFAGDLSERLQEIEALSTEAGPTPAAAQPRPKRKRVKENDLGIVLIDALTHVQGWMAEDRLATQLQLSGKQVRQMLGLLAKQGFVAREHRRERKHGGKVRSEAEYEGAAPAARTASYVSIDYPLFFDMLRLRVHLAKQKAADRIDDGNVRTLHNDSVRLKTLEKFACVSRDGRETVCGQAYDAIGMAFLEVDASGQYYKCGTCDNGIVAPDDELSRKEPNGVLRIKRAKFRRDAATKQREALVASLAPLDGMIKELEAVDPPDFGSFTDWFQAQYEAKKLGQAQAAQGGNGGGHKGRLDYGIDGPLLGNGQVDLSFDAAHHTEAATGNTITHESEGPRTGPSNLPYFMRQGGADGSAATAASADNGTAERSNEEIARYNAYVEQYKKQLAAQGQLGGKPAATGTKQEDGKGKVADPAEATDAVPSGAVKRPRSGEADEQLGHGAGDAADEDIEWEDEGGAADGNDAEVEWEDA